MPRPTSPARLLEAGNVAIRSLIDFGGGL